jgi:tetratricopeptide (TPR) repeat protein
MALFGITLVGKVKKAARLVTESRGLCIRDPAAARRKLDEALMLLRSVSEKAPDRDVTMANALLALAHIERMSDNSAGAVTLLEEARDFGGALLDADRDYLAIEMALAGRTDVRAVEDCLAFVAKRAGEPNAALEGPVYDLLEHCSLLDSATPPEDCAIRLHLCTTLIAADNRLGFPYYFRGWHAFQMGNYAGAQEDFRRAGERGYLPSDLSFHTMVCTGYQLKHERNVVRAAYYFAEAAKQKSDSYIANYEAGACLVDLIGQSVDEGPDSGEMDADRRRHALSLLGRACEIQDGSAAAHFMLGRAFYLDRKAEEAATALRKAATLQPCAAYFYEYARALRRIRAAHDAIAAVEEAVRLEPGMLKARWLIANISMRTRDFARAAREYQAIMPMLPPDDNGHRNAVYGLAVCCFELGDHERAIEAFQSLESQDLELSPEGRLILARSLMRRGDLSAAHARMTDLVAADPENGTNLYFLGCCQARQGRFEVAIVTLDAAEAAGAPSHTVALQRGQAYEALYQLDAAYRQYERVIENVESTAARLRIAMLCWTQGRHREAMAHLGRAEPTPDVLAARAELNAQQGDYASADTAFRQALESAPDPSAIRRRYSAVLLRLGEVKRAEEALGEDAHSGASAPGSAYLMGAIRLRAGDLEGAFSLWQQTEATPERDARLGAVALQVARQARDAGDYETALASWDRAIETGMDEAALRSDRAMAWLALGLQSARAGDRRKTWEPYVRCAVETDPENPDFVCLQAALELLTDDISNCMKRIENLCEKATPAQQPLMEYLLGLACLRCEDYAQAQIRFRAAMATGPDDIALAARVYCAMALARVQRWEDAASMLANVARN